MILLWWRRGELGCPRGLKTGKLLIVRCADNAKDAVIAGPSYVKLTWNELGNGLRSPSGTLRVHPVVGISRLPAIRHATRRLSPATDSRRRRSSLGRWQTHLNQSLHVVPGALGAPPVLKETAEAFRTSWEKVFDAVEQVVT